MLGISSTEGMGINLNLCILIVNALAKKMRPQNNILYVKLIVKIQTKCCLTKTYVLLHLEFSVNFGYTSTRYFNKADSSIHSNI